MNKDNEVNTPQGSNITFEEDSLSTRQYQTLQPSRIVKLVMRYSGGIVKNEKQANYILLVFVVLAIITSLLLISGGNGKSELKAPTGNKIIYSPNAPPRLQYPVYK